MKTRIIRPAAALALATFAISGAIIASAGPLPAAGSASDLPAPERIINTGDTLDRLLTQDWKFFKGDDSTAKSPDFNDSSWRTLDLPHDWSIEASFDPNLASCTAFLPTGIGWYRKAIHFPADAAGKTIRLRFDGVMNHSTVWCNGIQVGQRPYGYSSFTCDLTSSIKAGADNVIAVRVDHEQYADSRWYAGSGIYRNVFLNVGDKLHVDTNGTFLTTPRITADSADISLQATLKNDGPAADATLVTTITSADGQSLATLKQSASLPANSTKDFTFNTTLAHPALWSPDHPVIYRAVTQVLRGSNVVDEYVTPFGIRTFKFDPAKGFSLNGQSMKIKGVCVHHDAGVLGAAVPLAVWARRLKILQDAGINAIRCSHNPPAPEFLDLCDRMGFLVMDEAFDEWIGGKHKWIVGHNVGQAGTDGYHTDFDQWADTDIKDMVLRDRNHPSIILWSIGNEIDYNNDPFPPGSPLLPPVAERLIKDVKSVDTTRPVTAACAFPATNLYKTLLDVEGYNYMERLYADDHAAHPDRIIYGSENSQNLQAWQAVAQNDYIAGQFLWTGIDYLGEAGRWPSHGSGAGLLDVAGFPKNQYYFRQSLWSTTPMVYLSATGIGGGRGRGNGGQAGRSVFCVSNCDSVELFHDGQSLGSKPHAAGDVLSWPLEFSTGVFKAVGKKGSSTVTFELHASGPASKLVLEPDVKSLRPNGRDVAQIELVVTDQQGNRVLDAQNPITCAITGPGRILGIENGNLNTTEDSKALTRSTFQGRALIYVQSLHAPGDLHLTVTAPNLATTAASITVH